MERDGVCRLGSTVWPSLSPSTVHSSRRCPTMDYAPTGSVLAGPLRGRLRDHGGCREAGMRDQSKIHGTGVHRVGDASGTQQDRGPGH